MPTKKPAHLNATNLAQGEPLTGSRELEALKALLLGLHEMGFGTERHIDGADAVETIALLYRDVTQRILAGSGMEPLVIYSEANDGFWSSAEGDWVPIDDAQQFFNDPGAKASQYAEDARVVRLGFALAEQACQACQVG